MGAGQSGGFPMTAPDGRHLLLITGPPGAGKSTAVRALVGDMPCQANRWRETTLWLYRYRLPGGNEVCEPGKSHAGTAKGEAHRGTDLLQHNVQPHAEAWIRAELPGMILHEGCQVLASRTWLNLAASLGYNVQVAYLAAPEGLRKERVVRRGYSDWNEQWQQGLYTRTLRLAAEYGATMVPGWAPPEEVAAQLAAISPVAGRLRAAADLAGPAQGGLFEMETERGEREQ